MAEEIIDFAEIKKDAVNVIAEPSIEQDDEPDFGLIISEDDTKKEEVKVEETPEMEYVGTGVVTNKIPSQKVQSTGSIPIGPMADKERTDELTNALNEYDEEIAKQKALYEKRMKEREAKEQEQAENPTDLNDKDLSVEILIDKTGLGSITFTDEEKLRIEHARKIKLTEVIEEKLKTIKIKKEIKDKDDFKIVKKNFNKSFSPVIALASGYTAKMKNISAAEAIRMYQTPGPNTANSIIEKWSVIYDKLIDVSRGEFKDFEEFTEKTAFVDYEAFLYAMLSSSYPEKDSIEFNCEQDGCKKSFSVDYTNKEMIRGDLITDDQKNIISKIVANAAIIDTAKEIAEESPVNNTQRILIDDTSGIIAEFYLPSVKEMIERVFRNLDENEELTKEDNRNAVVLAQTIKAFYVPDYDEEDETYYKLTSLESVVHTINQLNEHQLRVLTTKIKEYTDPYSFAFGFKEVVCPHCKHNYGQYSMDLDRILFRRVQQRVMTTIE